MILIHNIVVGLFFVFPLNVLCRATIPSLNRADTLYLGQKRLSVLDTK